MDFRTTLIEAWNARETYPVYTETQPNPTLRDAYATQYSFVMELTENHDEEIAGFKGALTAPQAQAAMGIDEPILGVLLESGRAEKGVSPEFAAILETELGYRVHSDILSPVKPADVFNYVESVMPMMEIAAPNLPGRPTGMDLVASNSASYAYLEGPVYSLAHVEVDGVQTRLSSGAETLFSGSSGEVMGGQANALAWLINQALDVGYEVKAGYLFMTGSIGGMAPAGPGTYSAEFTGFEPLNLEISGTA